MCIRDRSILEFFENHEHPEVWDPHYGERTIETVEVTMEKEKKAKEKEFKKNFDMVKLESSSWTIEVPVRKKEKKEVSADGYKAQEHRYSDPQ